MYIHLIPSDLLLLFLTTEFKLISEYESKNFYKSLNF